jgi:diacylglycerol kinase (ATP)
VAGFEDEDDDEDEYEAPCEPVARSAGASGLRFECEVRGTTANERGRQEPAEEAALHSRRSRSLTMKIALFHNPGAGERALDGNQLIRRFAEAGHDVLYVPTQQKGWESAFCNPIDRAVIAGGDGTVSRLAPWLAARNIPFCILPLGTANNCAKTLGQTHPVEVVVANLDSASIRKVDLGVVTTPLGQEIFIESVGIGLLAQLMGEMRAREKKRKSRENLSPAERLSGAVKYLRSLAKEHPESPCELVLDDKVLTGDFLLVEVANMGLIGPNLNLIPQVDPGDGAFEVVWVGTDQRHDWREYLRQLQGGITSTAPIHTTRCHQFLFRRVNAPTHIDSKVFVTMATPVVVRSQPGALELLVIPKG